MVQRQGAMEDKTGQKQFFEFAGHLFSARIQPASTLVEVNSVKPLRVIAMDRAKRQIDGNLDYHWLVIEGAGKLDNYTSEMAVFQTPGEPGLCRIKIIVSQGQIVCEAETVITVVDTLIKPAGTVSEGLLKGLPGYTLESAPAKAWRSRYDKERNIIIINSGHRDFLFSGAEKIRKLRYICRLFSKELVLHNFAGVSVDELLERLVELSMYTEENLK